MEHCCEVLGSRPDQRNASDVDFLDDRLLFGSRSNRLFERIEVHDHQIDFRNFVLSHLLAVLSVVPARQNTAEHFGVKRLDTSAQDRWIARQVLHGRGCEAQPLDEREGPPRRIYFHAVGGQPTDDRFQTILVID